MFEHVGSDVQLEVATAGRIWTEEFQEQGPRQLPCTLEVTPNDPIIKSLVEEILAAKAWYDPRPNWQVLLGWMSANISYDFDKLNNWHYYFWDQLPRETIQRKKGVCIDTALLYASMLRACGYAPEEVYVIVGKVPLQNALSGKDWYHAWVIFKDSTFGLLPYWRPVETTIPDPTGGFLVVIVDAFSQVVDAVSNALTKDGVFYSDSFKFNDMYYERVR